MKSLISRIRIVNLLLEALLEIPVAMILTLFLTSILILVISWRVSTIPLLFPTVCANRSSKLPLDTVFNATRKWISEPMPLDDFAKIINLIIQAVYTSFKKYKLSKYWLAHNFLNKKKTCFMYSKFYGLQWYFFFHQVLRFYLRFSKLIISHEPFIFARYFLMWIPRNLNRYKSLNA